MGIPWDAGVNFEGMHAVFGGHIRLNCSDAFCSGFSGSCRVRWVAFVQTQGATEVVLRVAMKVRPSNAAVAVYSVGDPAAHAAFALHPQ